MIGCVSGSPKRTLNSSDVRAAPSRADHQTPRIEEADERGAFRGHAARAVGSMTSRSTRLSTSGVDDRRRRVARPCRRCSVRVSPSSRALVILARWPSAARALPSTDRDEAGLFAVEEFLDHHARPMRHRASAHRACRAIACSGVRPSGHRHDDALAGGKAVGLDHDRCAPVAMRGLRA